MSRQRLRRQLVNRSEVCPRCDRPRAPFRVSNLAADIMRLIYERASKTKPARYVPLCRYSRGGPPAEDEKRKQLATIEANLGSNLICYRAGFRKWKPRTLKSFRMRERRSRAPST